MYRKSNARKFKYNPRHSRCNKHHRFSIANKDRFVAFVTLLSLVMATIILAIAFNATSATSEEVQIIQLHEHNEEIANTQPETVESTTAQPEAEEEVDEEEDTCELPAPEELMSEVYTTQAIATAKAPAPAVVTPTAEQLKKAYTQAVKDIQKALNAYGYKLKVDGDFGPKTDMAVMDFQANNNLTVDGIVGPKTAKVLGIDLDFTYFSSYRYLKDKYDVSEYTSNTNWLIYSDWSDCIVNIYHRENSNQPWELYKSMQCANGKNTPKGVFSINGKHSGFWSHDKYYKWFTSFDGDFGFHSVAFNEGKAENNALGKHVTAGCIRLYEANARLIQDIIPENTTVVIVK